MTDYKYIEGVISVLVRDAFDLASEDSKLNQRAAAILAKSGYALFELLLDNDVPASVAVEGAKGVH